MAAITHFSLPANITEFKDPAKQAKMVDRWTRYVNAWTERSIQGDPWTVLFDRDRYWYYNPMKTDVPDGGTRAVIFWSAFPNRVQYILEQTYPGVYSEEDIYRIVDEGDPPDIPAEDCPALNVYAPKIDYHPGGPRGWLDEYCEFSVKRDADSGKILKVDFACENCDYWYTLWREDPEHVLELYRKLVGPQIAMEDLYLRGADGQPVIDPVTDAPAYDPMNRWNNGTKTLDDWGGAVHLTSSPNTLPDEIYIAGSATVNRKASKNPQSLVCAGNYGGPFRHSDPHINFVANQVVTGFNMRVTIGDPVGLYMQMPDFSTWKLPDVPGAEGKSPADFWKVKRGYAQGENPDLPGDMSYILHATIEVPEELGFTVSDIEIAGKPINWAGQIMQTFKIALAAVATPSEAPLPPPVPAQTPCPHPLPAPTQLMPMAVLNAGGRGVGGRTPSSPLAIAPGQTAKNIALVCANGAEGASIEMISPSGAQLGVTVRKHLKDQKVLLAGMEVVNTVNIYIVDIEAPPDAKPEYYGVQVTNPDGQGGPAAEWIIYVEAA